MFSGLQCSAKSVATSKLIASKKLTKITYLYAQKCDFTANSLDGEGGLIAASLLQRRCRQRSTFSAKLVNQDFLSALAHQAQLDLGCVLRRLVLYISVSLFHATYPESSPTFRPPGKHDLTHCFPRCQSDSIQMVCWLEKYCCAWSGASRLEALLWHVVHSMQGRHPSTQNDVVNVILTVELDP